MNERTDLTNNNNAVGDDALVFIDSLLTPEEIAESGRRVALIGERIKAEQSRND